jgi:hypothetical protein
MEPLNVKGVVARRRNVDEARSAIRIAAIDEPVVRRDECGTAHEIDHRPWRHEDGFGNAGEFEEVGQEAEVVAQRESRTLKIHEDVDERGWRRHSQPNASARHPDRDCLRL